MAKVHIFGASGSGTTTLASKLAKHFSWPYFDADHYYWLLTSVPFTQKRDIKDRITLMQADLSMHPHWLLSGSMISWGQSIHKLFDLAIFLWVPTAIRIKRIEKREQSLYGNRVLPGGDMHAVTKDFIEWSKHYDSGKREGRSLPKHQKWISQQQCSVCRIEGDLAFDEVFTTAAKAITDLSL